MNTHNLCIELDLDHGGSPYINVNVPLPAVQPYLQMLRTILGPLKFALYSQQQQFRDRGKHHITVINPLEYPTLALNRIGRFIAYPIHVHMLGIGHAQKADNEVFFIVCECPELMAIRAELNLAPTDFHITLGFKTSDIFDQPKNRSALIDPFSSVETLGTLL